MTRLLVIPNSTGGWDVKNGLGAPLSSHPTPQEAERAARELLERDGKHGEVVMHGRPSQAA